MKAKATLLVGMLFVASCSNLYLAGNQNFPDEYKTWSWYPTSESQICVNYWDPDYSYVLYNIDQMKYYLAETMKKKGYEFIATPENADFLIEVEYRLNKAYKIKRGKNESAPITRYIRRSSRNLHTGRYLMNIYDKQSDLLVWANNKIETFRHSTKYIANALNNLPKCRT